MIPFELNKVHCCDCLEALKRLPDKCVDLVLTDPPYGTTSCVWDKKIDAGTLLSVSGRITKPNSARIFFARNPLSSEFVVSGLKEYKHKWVWDKKQSGSFQNAKYMPLQIEEDILVFSAGTCNYYPIMRSGVVRTKGGAKKKHEAMNGLNSNHSTVSSSYYPTNILRHTKEMSGQHPTQKPVELLAYLIETYSKPSDLILDPFMGSGTTGVAAVQLGRQFLGFEIDPEYCRLANDRIEAARKGLKLNEYRQGQQTLFQ
jgi:site-specific DNA-methyltransferase (adenine-specific)